MTSSLVGSEMCIRDRFRNPHDTTDSGGQRAPAASGLGWTQEHHVRGTVSYTHLTLPTICSV
eukprot:6431300-Prorocentrum_lima.AAC.1